MYISNMLHFLDETGNIPKDMHKSARELANFHALVVDETTKSKAPVVLTGLSGRNEYFNKKHNTRRRINCIVRDIQLFSMIDIIDSRYLTIAYCRVELDLFIL
jgi:hypothetical protein